MSTSSTPHGDDLEKLVMVGGGIALVLYFFSTNIGAAIVDTIGGLVGGVAGAIGSGVSTVLTPISNAIAIPQLPPTVTTNPDGTTTTTPAVFYDANGNPTPVYPVSN